VDGVQVDPLDACIWIEYLHRSSVIIDDIQDGDDRRRGVNAIHADLGLAVALSLAHSLLAQALASSANCGPRIGTQFLNTYADMAKGQSMDLGIKTVSFADPSESARMKTGRLVSLAFWLGATLRGCSDAVASECRSIGELIGTAFQLRNDITNASGLDRRSPGRPTDLLAGRMSAVAVSYISLGGDLKSIPESGASSDARLVQALTRVRGLTTALMDEARSRCLALDADLRSVIMPLISSDELAGKFVADQAELQGSLR
jgi:geranylgeranyl pyrophosphate synthase